MLNKDFIVGQGISIAAIVGSLAGWLPPLASLVGIIYYGLLIWEGKTVQAWLQRRRERKLAKDVKLVRAAIADDPVVVVAEPAAVEPEPAKPDENSVN